MGNQAHRSWQKGHIMSTITKQQRVKIVKYVGEQTSFDADTVQISRAGVVSAIRDSNKTFNGPHTERVTLGTAQELLRELEAAR